MNHPEAGPEPGMMQTLLAFADDLTGAMEIGGLCAQRGVRSLVRLAKPFVWGRAEALIIDTESRELSPDQAGPKVYETASRFNSTARCVYKKTDSTLRGAIGVELEALMKASPGRPLVYAPAYPRLGRLVCGGRLFVNGSPLEETEFLAGAPPVNRTSDLRQRLEPHIRAAIILVESAAELQQRIESCGPAVYVCDGKTDRDLDAVADVVLARKVTPLLAGPAGFAGCLIERLPGRCHSLPPYTGAQKGLIVCGSLHSASREQLLRANALGVPLFSLPLDSASDEELGDDLIAQYKEKKWASLQSSSVAGGSKPAISAARDTAQRLAELSRRVLRDGQLNALVLFGGHTAQTVLARLGVKTIEPLGELLAGIPVGQFTVGPRRTVLVTKAGGFGGVDAVREIRSALS